MNVLKKVCDCKEKKQNHKLQFDVDKIETFAFKCILFCLYNKRVKIAFTIIYHLIDQIMAQNSINHIL